jgi:thiamine-monophosphate kinase
LRIVVSCRGGGRRGTLWRGGGRLGSRRVSGDISCERSKLGADVELAKLPLSRATMRALKRDPHLLESVVAGGDDYELLFAAPPSRRQAVLRAAAASKTQATPIGRFAAKPGRARFLDASGAERRFARAGFTHF